MTDHATTFGFARALHHEDDPDAPRFGLDLTKDDRGRHPNGPDDQGEPYSVETTTQLTSHPGPQELMHRQTPRA
ncbi:hypothetical protein BIV57_17975 [Mangrovactinospora gilvigrisea]|uniref:Uncharacterized protein n=1 Tax=Mangrovactinospora gilvigrisea TaxID=1428644 RepID=A0A1J7BBW7_9ACTN|nr:hypothetical protein [Mangrovactinospora gilvigrisea]OIV36126.1 hypothetical protein BIV57_17975 [Mangrovactinospora gilvigrisea]